MGADLVDHHNVGVVDCSHRLGLPEEKRLGWTIRDQEHLNDNMTAQLRLLAQENAAHPALTEKTDGR